MSQESNKLLAAEISFCRKITKTSWTARQTNYQIFEEENAKRETVQTLSFSKTRLFKHLIRFDSI